MALIEISDAAQLGGLLDAAGYRSFVEELSGD
jgi:hypothetical protein